MLFKRRKKEQEPEALGVDLSEKEVTQTKASKVPINEASVIGIGYGDTYVNRIMQKTGLTTLEMWYCYVQDEWVRACVDKIIKEVVKYQIVVVPKETSDEMAPETQAHIDEVTELLENPNEKIESFDNIRRKYLRDILVYDAGAMEIVYANSGKPEIEASLKSINKKLFNLELNKKVIFDKKKIESIDRDITKIKKERLSLKKQLKVVNKQIEEKGNKPVELYDVAGVNIKVNVDEAGNFMNGKPAYLYYSQGNSLKPDVEFTKEELIYFLQYPTAGRVYGLSPIETLYDTVQADIQAAKLNRRRLDNDGMISGVLAFPGMSQAKLSRNQNFWKMQAKKKGARLVLTSSDKVSFTRVAESHQEMQFMEYQRWTLVKIMAVYGMQPIVLGVITENTGKLNSEEQRKQFKSDAVLPLIELETHHLTDVLIQQGFGYDDIKCSYVEPTQESTQTENVDKADKMGKLGVITINEARGFIGLKRLEEGGDQLVMVNQLRQISEELGKSQHKGTLAEIKQRIDDMLKPNEPIKESINEEEQND